MSPATQTRVHTAYVLIGLNLVLVALLIGTVVYVSGLRDKVESTTAQSRAGCARGNLIRAQINYNSSVVQSFLSQAASTREQTAQHAEEEGDPVTARINRDAANAYRGLQSGFTPLKIIDCEALYP